MIPERAATRCFFVGYALDKGGSRAGAALVILTGFRDLGQHVVRRSGSGTLCYSLAMASSLGDALEPERVVCPVQIRTIRTKT